MLNEIHIIELLACLGIICGLLAKRIAISQHYIMEAVNVTALIKTYVDIC